MQVEKDLQKFHSKLATIIDFEKIKILDSVRIWDAFLFQVHSTANFYWNILRKEKNFLWKNKNSQIFFWV